MLRVNKVGELAPMEFLTVSNEISEACRALVSIDDIDGRSVDGWSEVTRNKSVTSSSPLDDILNEYHPSAYYTTVKTKG